MSVRPRILLFSLFSITVVFGAIFRVGAGDDDQARADADTDFTPYGIYEDTAPRPPAADPIVTTLPLRLESGDRIALVGNTLFDRARHFGHFEAYLQQRYPEQSLIVRNLSWSADSVDLQPRPANFADVEQHLFHERADVIFAAFGFNESFAGPEGAEEFRDGLNAYVASLKTKAFNGESAPQIVLVSPIANENVAGVPAADLNNANIRLYADVIRDVADEQQVGFVDVFAETLAAMEDAEGDQTMNGIHLTEDGYDGFSRALFRGTFGETPPDISEQLREGIVDKNNQFFRRYRPLNTFYYTGGRRKSYGYLDFLPAMRNFDVMTANRDQRIWDIADGAEVSESIDDSNVPPLPEAQESRGANNWMTAEDEFASFQIDPRFDVTLFAGEEEFPDIAAPIQMRWDGRGRLWVSCSTTYPHVYPGNEPVDKLVILEDTDGDGKADKSTVFADDLHIPLSFEFGDGGVYVSEMPDLTFLQDTDGDDRADVRRRVLTGFGTEDSHHALHDMTWTPDGDLVFRESVFHHTQVETPYGPVRQQNSGWFRFQPRDHRLTSFGTYSSTNPWGVTFDDWGRHVASHPIFAAAFHALDPPYPQQHPKPAGLRAYSGTCGHEFVDFATFPDALQGGFIKVRYKPTNRVEIHNWIEDEFGCDEEYVSDLIFSSNLSFIPVDLQFGPRGALYVCDWYNPVKGHAQYSLRDDRRDRHSGRIWRITAKGHELQDPPQIEGAPIADLIDLLERPEYRYRYWAKRELRERDPAAVEAALDDWVADLDRADPRYRHHQIEAVWMYRGINAVRTDLLRELLACDQQQARAAAMQQLHFPDTVTLLRTAANDTNGLVRMEAAIAASYVGTKDALDAMLDVFKHPREGHLAYAITCALGSHTLRRHWEGNSQYNIERLLRRAGRDNSLREPTPSASQAEFDTQPDLKLVRIGCIPERMRYTVEQFAVTTGQPIKVVFTNPDATDHNLLFVQPGALEEVGMAANDMARDPANANSNFIPEEKRDLIIESAPMIGPTRRAQVHVLRFEAPTEPGIYPFVCTFPGHWVIMRGNMVVADDLNDVEAMLAAAAPQVVREWTMADFEDLGEISDDEVVIMRGMQAFRTARCNQCHIMQGHGVNLGPDLTETIKRVQEEKLLRQILEPSHEINEKYRTWQILTVEGEVITGFVKEENEESLQIVPNLLTPDVFRTIAIDDIEVRTAASVSSMPEGMVNVLTEEEILDLLAFIQAGGYELPEHLKGGHGHHHPE